MITGTGIQYQYYGLVRSLSHSLTGELGEVRSLKIYLLVFCRYRKPEMFLFRQLIVFVMSFI